MLKGEGACKIRLLVYRFLVGQLRATQLSRRICISGYSEHTFREYQSLRAKGSWVFFLRPFLPLDNLLFLF